jgi:MFS family permease
MPLLKPPSAIVVGSAIAVAGFGIGLSSVATTSLVTDVPEPSRATASGIVNTGAQLGTAIGPALLLLLAAITTGVPAITIRAPVIAWATAAIIALTAAAAFARLPPTAAREDPVVTSQVPGLE